MGPEDQYAAVCQYGHNLFKSFFHSGTLIICQQIVSQKDQMKNILLAVTGLNPQVITETLYALHQNNRYVDAIHVITTRDGKEKIYAELLGERDGHYYRYLEKIMK